MGQRRNTLRGPGEPAVATARKISIALELICSRRISVLQIQRRFGISDRQMTRDLQQLRSVGVELGFTIGRRNPQGYVELNDFRGRPVSIVAGEQNLQAAIAEIFRAFGEPLRGLTQDAMQQPKDVSFLHFVMPKLSKGSGIAMLLAALRSAWESRARVGFRYHDKEREVEPSAVVVRSGRYYLIGRQVGQKAGWRVFALDEIVGPVRRCGTFEPKAPPEEYLSGDAVGWIKTEKTSRVDVTVTARFAQVAISRQWQAAQKVRRNADGTMTLTFTVGEPDEVIRWALGFGEEAWVSGPPVVVGRARDILAAIVERYR